MIAETVVLLRVQHFEQRRGGVAADIHAHLVDLVEQKQRIAHSRLGQFLQQLARQRTDIGAAVAANFGFVANAAKRHAHEFAVGRPGDGLTERSLADARRTRQAENRPLELFHPLLDREIFEHALLHFLQPVMIGFENFLGLVQIESYPAAFLPGHGSHPVEIRSHYRGLGRHGRHHLQLFPLR